MALVTPFMIMEINWIGYVNDFILLLMVLYVPTLIYFLYDASNHYRFKRPKPIKKTSTRVNGIASNVWINYASDKLVSLSFFYLDKMPTLYLDRKRMENDNVNHMHYCDRRDRSYILLNDKRVIVYCHLNRKVVLDNKIHDLFKNSTDKGCDSLSRSAIQVIEDVLHWRYL